MDEKFLSISQDLSHLNQLHQNQKIGNRLKNIEYHTAEQDDPQLQAACAEMESLFLSHLLKEMRATVDKSGFMDGGQAEEIFTSLMDVEISKRMSAAGGIGLASILLAQLGDSPSGNKDSD